MDCVLNKEKIHADIESLKNEILQNTPKKDFDDQYLLLKEKWNDPTESILTIVSGKDYLIPLVLLKSQMFRKSKALPSLQEAKFNLLRDCDLTRFDNLKKTIESLK